MAVASAFALFLCVAFLLLMESGAQSGDSTKIKLGSYLYPNGTSSWHSPSGFFAFGFYPQGDRFAVGVWLIYPNSTQNTVVWTANREDPPVSFSSRLDLSIDGKLLLFTEGNSKLIAEGIDPARSAAMLDSGNFVLYDSNSSVIWESFNYPTDTILGGQNLTRGQQLFSSESASNQSRGRFFLSMQDDGNLVAYPFNSPSGPEDSYWSSGSQGIPRATNLSLDQKGFLAVVLANSSAITLALASPSFVKNKTLIYRATLDVDGNFRLYSHHFESPSNMSVAAHWAALSDPCDVNGFCGLNSYCSAMDGAAHCSCFPGFELVEPISQFSDCFRNFIEDECNRKASIPMQNVTLSGDFPYFRERMSSQDCAISCSEDCYCEAAIYTDNSCSKYKPPLRYAKQNINISSKVFLISISNNSEVANDVPPSIIKYKSRKSLVMILTICFAFPTCLCFIFAAFSIFFCVRRAHRYKKLSQNAKMRLEEELTMRSFPYEDLKKVTNGFKEMIGRGSIGQIYKGFLSANKPVAVKKLEKMIGGEREFRSQMATIGRTHHRNVVRLLGFCVEGPKVLLVYEFMSNGSLADLFKEKTTLSWRMRLRIALDMARGLLYLHEECQVPITHYNIKPQNILLDDSMTAKISDFGLAKLLMPNQSRTSKYLAPEWQNNALMSRQSDIYSFGIVLLEIACCRSNIEVNVARADEIALTVWAYNCYMAGRLDQLVDEENVDLNILERMVKVALLCIQDQPPLRPPMKTVILMLERMMHIPDPPPSAALVIS